MNKPALEATSCVVRSADILSAEVDREVVLMSVEQGVYYGLNAVGARVWELMDEPISIHALCQRVVEEFDVTMDQCQGEVMALLEDMHEQDLVQHVSPAP